MADNQCASGTRLAMNVKKTSGEATFKGAKPLGTPFTKTGKTTVNESKSRIVVTKYKS